MTSGNYQKIIELTKAVGADYKALKEEINNVLEELTEYSYQEEQEIGEIDG